MYQLELIRHKEATKSQLDEVIRIKSITWTHPYELQIDWFNKNLIDTDIHAILLLDGKSVAYLNLIDISINIDGETINGYGIGNVCSIVKGKGWGKEIMMLTNRFLEKENKTGLLFCRDRVLQFYKKCKWNIINKKKLTLNFNNDSIETMIFNRNLVFEHLEYIGRTF